jgi:serine/threonine protein kinase
MVNGNLKSPYIGKYYLDVAEGSIDTITKRTIFTRFEKGDLFTEVAYASHYGLYHYTFLEYLTIFEQLAEGIAFLHKNSVVHRDIKPTNVLFQYHSRNRLLCKLIDFGSCFVLRESAKHLFNPKVFTTPKFNLTYREAAKRAGNWICEEFTQN